MAINRRQFVKQTASIGLGVGGGFWVTGLAEPADAADKAPLRPPGALPEDDFISTCIRCLRCVDACPNQALVSMPQAAPGGGAGTPTMEMRKASCMLCMSEDGDFLKCGEACPSGAIQLVKKTPQEIRDKVQIGVAEIDLDLCYSYNHWSCGACYRACPLAGEAMTLGMWERPTVHPEACIGCGCCERSCIRYPHAIRVRGEART